MFNSLKNIRVYHQYSSLVCWKPNDYIQYNVLATLYYKLSVPQIPLHMHSMAIAPSCSYDIWATYELFPSLRRTIILFPIILIGNRLTSCSRSSSKNMVNYEKNWRIHEREIQEFQYMWNSIVSGFMHVTITGNEVWKIWELVCVYSSTPMNLHKFSLWRRLQTNKM